MAGHGNAGLASNFIDIAHAKVRNGGVLALVLPASFLQGEAWSHARSLFARHYRDIAVVSIAAVGSTDRAFSADTGMAEVLVVATRRDGESSQKEPTLYVNLAHRPQTILEAVAMAWSTRRFPKDRKIGPILMGSDEKAGCYIRSTLSQTGSAGVREAGVAEAAAALAEGRLQLPRRPAAMELPVSQLGALGNRGLYHMDISGTETLGSGLPRGPFDVASMGSDEFPTWPALWRHAASRETQMIVDPDRQGVVRPGCDDRAAQVWERTASRLHFNRDFRLNSQPLAACMTPEPTLGGTAWPNFLCTDKRWERPLALWANTTLGLLAFWWIGTCQQLGRARLSISKLPTLTVLDGRRLSPAELDHADTIFHEFEGRELLPANEAWRDETRQALDRAVLIHLLGLQEDVSEPLALLRRQWCAEPTVHGGKSTRPQAG